MGVELIIAEDLRFNADGSINMIAVFAHLGDKAVPFTANPTDIMEHGRLIHARALSGEFGAVAPYIPPTESEVAARDNPPLRRQQMKLAAEQTTHWDMMDDTTHATAWRSYYRELHALEASPEWPLVEQWPVAPELAA